MEKEQRTFITKLIKRLGDEDWSKWLEEERKTADSLKISSNDVFHDNLLKKIKYEIIELKNE